MHFSIPDTQELYTAESTGTTYTGYNIYINGSYHCCLRYKQMRALHEQLRRRSLELPVFPPRRLLPLNGHQLEVRRAALEHYLQLIGQDMRISKLDYFQNFLLNAQLETALAEGTELDENLDVDVDIDEFPMKTTILEVVLMNGFQLQVNCRVGDNSTTLLHKVCQCLHLPTHFVPYFCLYLIRDSHSSQNELVLIRRLMDFESPFLSRLLAKPCQIYLRKSYWNPSIDLKLLQDTVALNLLFIQTVSDIEHEWIMVPPETYTKLRKLKDHNLKREYVDLARQWPLYGCLQFAGILVDDFTDTTPVHTSTHISIGNKELSMRRTGKDGKIYETKFRVTRMRCWRVTTLHNTADLESKRDSPSMSVPHHSNLQLSFEYLMSKQTLRWITIISPQAMLMSVCLQSMVDELLNSKDGTELSPKGDSDNVSPCSYTSSSSSSSNFSNSCSSSYVMRNGRVTRAQPGRLAFSSSTSSLCHSQEQQLSTSPSDSSAASTPTAPVKFLSQERKTKQQSHPRLSSSNFYSAVFFRNDSGQKAVHNEAFEGIGDDDL